METKKLIQSAGLIAIGAVLVIAGKFIFGDKKTKQIKELEQEIVELKTELNLIDDSRPSNIVPLDFAKELSQNYDSTRIKWTDAYVRGKTEDTTFNATRSLYYNLDSLYNYLAYIRRISKEAKITPSGLRFYFGSYDKNYERKGKDDYAYRQTFFITPTQTITEGKRTLQLGYTLDDDFKPIYIRDSIPNVNLRGGNGASVQKAGFFSFNTNILYNNNSTVANELNGSPPRGKQ